MKKLLFLIILLFMSFSFAQQISKNFSSLLPVTLSGDSLYSFTLGDNTVKTYSGVIGFQFTFTSDTLNYYYFRGKLGNSTNWVNISSADSVMPGTYAVFDETPNYTSYQLSFDTVDGDTIIIPYVNVIYKKE